MTVGLLLLIGILAFCNPAYAGRCRVSSAFCGDGGPQQTVPLKIYWNFLVVAEGQFGGVSGRQNFVLDTGTAPSVINERLVKQLGLATVPSTITGLGKTVATQAAVIPELAIGPMVAVSLPVRLQNLSSLERELGIPIAGIIGLDVLSKSSFHLDYDKKQIEFGDISSEGIPVTFDPNLGLAVAAVRIGDRSLRMLVDTGSDRFVILGGSASETGWLALRNTSQSAASLLDQKMRIQEFSAPEITLGEQHFSKERAYVVPGAADPAFDGLLGVRALGFSGVSYDQARRIIYLQK